MGGFGADVIGGNAGADTLHGRKGADDIVGRIGTGGIQMVGVSDISGLAETIDGGNVMDALDFQTLGATGWVELSLATVTNFDDVRGTAGADTFLFSALTGNAVVITRAGRIRFQVATAMTFCCAAADFQL